MYKDVSIRQPTQDSTNLKLLDDKEEHERYWFARHCYKYSDIMTLYDISWRDWFEKSQGITLERYIKFAKKNKLGEKYGIQNKSR